MSSRPLQLRAIGNRQNLFGLLPRQPVPFPGSGLLEVGAVGQLGCFFGGDHVRFPRLLNEPAHGGKPDVDCLKRPLVRRRPPLEQKLPGERPIGSEGEEMVQRLTVVPLGVSGPHRINHHLLQPQQGGIARNRGLRRKSEQVGRAHIASPGRLALRRFGNGLLPNLCSSRGGKKCGIRGAVRKRVESGCDAVV